MNEKEMNSTEWNDGMGNAVEINDPKTLAENADGKWHRVKGSVPIEATINGKKITLGKQYFNGYKMNMSATARVTKAENAIIWIGVFVSLIVGILVSLLKNPMVGIFIGLFLFIGTFVVIGAKALLRVDPEKNSKIVIWFCSLFICALIMMGAIIMILF